MQQTQVSVYRTIGPLVFFGSKNENIKLNFFIYIFRILDQNINCGYMLELPNDITNTQNLCLDQSKSLSMVILKFVFVSASMSQRQNHRNK